MEAKRRHRDDDDYDDDDDDRRATPHRLSARYIIHLDYFWRLQFIILKF